MEDNKKHICKYCKKEFKSGQSLGAHIVHCKDNPNNHIDEFSKRRTEHVREKNPLLHYTLICEVCGSNYEIDCLKNNFNNGKYKHTCSSKCAHKLTVNNTDINEKNKNISLNSHSNPFLKNKHLENGIWLENDDEYNRQHRIYYKDTLYKKCICDICGNEFDVKELSNGRYSKSKFCSKKCYSKFYSNFANEHDFGGKNYSKKFHNGKYHGIRCDSSWELAYLVYNLEHNIPIKRCNIKFYYIDENNIKRKYTPDFIINDNEIIEIKGYLSDRDRLKNIQNKQVHILFYEDLIDVFNYIKNKYGNKFWEILYDNKNI